MAIWLKTNRWSKIFALYCKHQVLLKYSNCNGSQSKFIVKNNKEKSTSKIMFVKAHTLCNDIYTSTHRHTDTQTYVMQNKYVYCFKKSYISEVKMCPNSKDK